MTEHDAFLESILESPDDDTPRLMYADWLQEHGDDRQRDLGEFIHVQCMLAPDPHCEWDPWGSKTGCNDGGGRPFPCPPCALRRRQQQLLPANWYRRAADGFEKFSWMPSGEPGEISCWRREQSAEDGWVEVCRPRFVRGFLEELTTDPDEWVRHGDELGKCRMLQRVKLTRKPLYTFMAASPGNGDDVFQSRYALHPYAEGDPTITGIDRIRHVRSGSRPDPVRMLLKKRWPRIEFKYDDAYTFPVNFAPAQNSAGS